MAMRISARETAGAAARTGLLGMRIGFDMVTGFSWKLCGAASNEKLLTAEFAELALRSQRRQF
jgi:hypothetical protein